MGFKIGSCWALNEMRALQHNRASSRLVWFLPKRSVYEWNASSFISFNLFSCRLTSAVLFANELLRQEQAKLNEARKISVVNVNPTNIRPHSDTPEIRKYKKRFNSEILCAALWGTSRSLWYMPFLVSIAFHLSQNQIHVCGLSGVNLLVGTENGLMLLDRSGQGKVYNLITRRRFQQMDVLEGLNVLVTISGLSQNESAW